MVDCVPPTGCGRSSSRDGVGRVLWPQNTNHWRAITRLDEGLQLAHAATAFAVNQHQPAALKMNRDDVLFWLLTFWFVALCGAAIWVLFFWPAYGP
jgi:hypothetical protein